MSDRNANSQSTGTPGPEPSQKVMSLRNHEVPVYDRCSCEALLKPMS